MLSDRFQNLPQISVAAPGPRPDFQDPRAVAESWAARWREAGLQSGDRLVVSLPNGPSFVAALIACLRLELTFVPLHPGLGADERERRAHQVAGAALFMEEGLRSLGTRSRMPAPAPAVILFTSGSAGGAKPVALSEAALLHVVDTHSAAVDFSPGAELRSYLPWSHAFGFTLELLMGLLNGGWIGCVLPSELPESLARRPADFLLTVPRMIQRLDPALLRELSGGIVGGAPIRGELRRKLIGTQLRVGYGQTECSPGAALGAPGQWDRDDYLGSAVGCELRLRPVDEQEELQLRGPNLAMGYVRGVQIEPLQLEEGWRSTGDLASPMGNGFLFQGRRDELLKLDNGRMLNPVPLELPFDGAILLVSGTTAEGLQPLARGRVPSPFHLSVPHAEPRLMPDSFWRACTTPTGKVSRFKAQRLFEESCLS